MKILAYAAAATLTAGTAFAGGLAAPVITAEPVAAAPAAADWTGFYAGLNYGTGTRSIPFDSFDADTFVVETDFDGFGIHAGYLRDFGQYVLGAELDYSAITMGDDADTTDVLRLRGIAGYDLGRVLPYATLGLAKVTTPDDLSDTGIVYGIGVDYLVTERISLGLEYTRMNISEFEGESFDVETDTVRIRASYRF
ncbi:MAG: porin family protein [Paracoccaceae bacterium]